MKQADGQSDQVRLADKMAGGGTVSRASCVTPDLLEVCPSLTAAGILSIGFSDSP